MTYSGTAAADLRGAQEAPRSGRPRSTSPPHRRARRDRPSGRDRPGRTSARNSLVGAAPHHSRQALTLGACLLLLGASARGPAGIESLAESTVAPTVPVQAEGIGSPVPPSSLLSRLLEGPFGGRELERSFMTGLGAVATAPALRAAATVPPGAVLVAPTATPGTPAFTHPLDGSATYFPLVPGTRFTYEGTVADDEGVHRHELVFVVTDLVKEVDGLDARVILDRDYSDGVLTESELAFFAQDDAGNVWTRGEYPEEYEEGTFTGAPSTWITGVRGARAGILVPGAPAVGTAPFVQGRAAAVGFYDVGQVVAEGKRVCIPLGCYSGGVEIRESAPNAPDDGVQLKYYAPHVGGVRIAAQGGDSREVMVLRSLRRLGPGDLQAARAAALQLDRHAYVVSKDYRTTGRAHVGG